MRHRRMTGARPMLWSTLMVLGALSACSTSSARSGQGAGLVAQLSVERFLQAANERDIEMMGRLFGTADGPILETGSTFGCMFKKIGSWFGGNACVDRRDVEVRLDAIAQLLRHDDYVVVEEQGLAGRLGEARQVFVNLTVQGEQVGRVPFTVVRTSGGGWLVEAVDLERVMARR